MKKVHDAWYVCAYTMQTDLGVHLKILAIEYLSCFYFVFVIDYFICIMFMLILSVIWKIKKYSIIKKNK